MPKSNVLCALVAALPLFQCGGGGGTDSTNPTAETEVGTHDEDTNDDTPKSGTNAETEQVELTEFEGGSLLLDNKYAPKNVTIQGINIELVEEAREPLFVDSSNSPELVVFDTKYGSRVYTYGIGFHGKNVDGTAASWYQTRYDYGYSDYQISGDLTPVNQMPEQFMMFEGWTMVTRPGTPNGLKLTHNISIETAWEIDLNRGEFEGYNPVSPNILAYEGSVEGNQLTGYVTTPVGGGEITGHFFGDKGHEIAGGAKNGEISFLFFGAYNQSLTNAKLGAN